MISQGRQGLDPPVEREPTRAQAPAAWYADPTQRWELRYWDGTEWTDHVSTRGVVGTDRSVPAAIDLQQPALGSHSVAEPSATSEPQPAPPGRPRRKIARQARRAGAGKGEPGDGTLFTEQVLVVNQKAKLVGSTLGYAVYDKRGRRLGTVNEVRRDLSTKMSDLYRVRGDRTRAYRFQIVDLKGQILLAMNRPEAGFWGRAPLIIEGPGGSTIGQIIRETTGIGNAASVTAHGLKDMVRGASFTEVAKRAKAAAQDVNVFGGAKFQLEADGVLLARIHSANYRAWNFSIQAADGSEVAKITKTWAGWAKERFSKADNYVVAMSEPLEEPLRSLVIAAAIAIDFELKQGAQTRGSTLWGTRTYE